jgi:hypothetical protein
MIVLYGSVIAAMTLSTAVSSSQRRVDHHLKRPVTHRQRVVFAPCPLRAQTAGNSRLIASTGGVRPVQVQPVSRSRFAVPSWFPS